MSIEYHWIMTIAWHQDSTMRSGTFHSTLHAPEGAPRGQAYEWILNECRTRAGVLPDQFASTTFFSLEPNQLAAPPRLDPARGPFLSDTQRPGER